MLDPLSGYINVASKLFNNEKISSSYNLGPGEDSNMQVVEVCERALLKWGNPVGIVVEESEFKAVGEAKFLSLDSSLAFRDLGWKTKLNANQAIDWTVDWEKELSKIQKVNTKQLLLRFRTFQDCNVCKPVIAIQSLRSSARAFHRLALLSG